MAFAKENTGAPFGAVSNDQSTALRYCTAHSACNSKPSHRPVAMAALQLPNHWKTKCSRVPYSVSVNLMATTESSPTGRLQPHGLR